MIGISRDSIPLAQQRLRSLQLASNRRRCIRAHSDAHWHILALRQPSVRQNINHNLRSLRHITNLLAIHVAHSSADLPDLRLIVHVKASSGGNLRIVVQEPGSEVSRLYDRDFDIEWFEFRTQSLGDSGTGPLRSSVEGVAWASVPRSERTEVRDRLLAWRCAEVWDESFADVEHAEDVGVEGVVVFFGSLYNQSRC